MAFKSRRVKTCSGKNHVGLAITCKTCRGKGKETIYLIAINRHAQINCERCGGYGWFCTSCKRPRNK